MTDERIELNIPLTRLSNIISEIGVDRHQFHDHFEVVNSATAYPVIYRGEEDVRKKMTVKPNAYATGKTERAEEVFRKYASRLLVPDRIRWDTAHVISLYSEVPVLANMFYAVKLKVCEDIREYVEKALALWFNTSWGILIALFSREETEGSWSEIKMAQWRVMYVLDITKLDDSTLRILSAIFDKYSDKLLGRIPEQFNPQNPSSVRLGIDTEFLKALKPEEDEERIKMSLKELYRHINTALALWIKG